MVLVPTDATVNAKSGADDIFAHYCSFCSVESSTLSASIYKAARHAKIIVYEFLKERINSLPHSLLKALTSFFISAFTPLALKYLIPPFLPSTFFFRPLSLINNIAPLSPTQHNGLLPRLLVILHHAWLMQLNFPITDPHDSIP